MDRARSEDSGSRFENIHAADQTIQPQEAMYACTICFQTATHPITSTCGHLFCWECLFTWLRGQPRPCPVCRTDLIQGVNIIPIFTNTGVDESPGETLSNFSSPIPQRPPPPSPDCILGPIPLPSPVGVVLNTVETTVDNLTPDILEEILNDLTDNFEISRERVDSLGQTVENLVLWNLRLRQENDRNAQLIDSMNGHHAQEIEGIHRQYAEEIDGMRRIHAQLFEAVASLRQLPDEIERMHRLG